MLMLVLPMGVRRMMSSHPFVRRPPGDMAFHHVPTRSMPHGREARAEVSGWRARRRCPPVQAGRTGRNGAGGHVRQVRAAVRRDINHSVEQIGDGVADPAHGDTALVDAGEDHRPVAAGAAHHIRDPFDIVADGDLGERRRLGRQRLKILRRLVPMGEERLAAVPRKVDGHAPVPAQVEFGDQPRRQSGRGVGAVDEHQGRRTPINIGRCFVVHSFFPCLCWMPRVGGVVVRRPSTARRAPHRPQERAVGHAKRFAEILESVPQIEGPAPGRTRLQIRAEPVGVRSRQPVPQHRRAQPGTRRPPTTPMHGR
jgi:hypothetical protein